VSAETYRQHIMPIIEGWITLCRRETQEELVLIQDGASGHTARDTLKDLIERHICCMR
jgi:hypothetical protein